jgi:hypothetical protein
LLANPTKAAIDALAANERQRKSLGRQLADADEALRTWRAGHNGHVRNRESAESDLSRSASTYHKARLAEFQTTEQCSVERGDELQAKYDTLKARLDALGAELDRINHSAWAG